jgi:hypothetical protein
MIRELGQENAALKNNWRKTQREKAGKASALVRMKRKFDDMEEENDEDIGSTCRNKSVQTNVNLREDEQLIKVVRDTGTKLKNIEVLSGKEEKSDEKRSYGESTFVRLPSARSTWPNNKVSTRAVQGRAAIVRDFISLISGSSSIGENVSIEESDKIDRFLFIHLIKQNKEVFKELLRSSKEVLSLIMKMTPEETSKFMHASNSSYNQKRKMATMFGKIFGFNPLSSKKQQKLIEKSKQMLVERSKLEFGTLLLHKTATAEYSTLCAFVRVTDLSLFIVELHTRAISEEVPDQNSLKNLDHPLFFNKLWIVISGDKGSSTMKFAAGVGGHDPHLLGLFEASDTPENLLIFQSKYREQISQLVAFGLDLPQNDGSTKAVEVEVLVCGDKAFLSDENGHAGAAASFPSIYRLVTSEHLRKKHLDGSPHNRANPECFFQERTPEIMEMDYHLNMSDTRSGTLRTRGKYHNSIVGPRLFPLPSQYNFAVSSLHIGLMIPLRLMGYMEAEFDMIDGTKCDNDLAGIEARCDEWEGLAEEARDLETIGQAEEIERDETLTYVMRSNKVQREILEVQWQAKSMEVVEKEADMKEMSDRICAEISTLDRVVFLLKGDVSGVEKIARKMSKSRYSLKSFGKWEPRNSWQCDLCLLTGFDRDIQWKVCSNCQKSTHVFCQVSSEEELSNLNTFTVCSLLVITVTRLLTNLPRSLKYLILSQKSRRSMMSFLRFISQSTF